MPTAFPRLSEGKEVCFVSVCFHMCLTLCMCIKERGTKKKTRKIPIDYDDSMIVVVVRICGLLPWKQISASKMVPAFELLKVP